jgi:hypothetical protein
MEISTFVAWQVDIERRLGRKLFVLREADSATFVYDDDRLSIEGIVYRSTEAATPSKKPQFRITVREEFAEQLLKAMPDGVVLEFTATCYRHAEDGAWSSFVLETPGCYLFKWRGSVDVTYNSKIIVFLESLPDIVAGCWWM